MAPGARMTRKFVKRSNFFAILSLEKEKFEAYQRLSTKFKLSIGIHTDIDNQDQYLLAKIDTGQRSQYQHQGKAMRASRRPPPAGRSDVISLVVHFQSNPI